MPDAGVLATMLLVLGLFLLGLEFFIPSFGMILVIAVLSLIVSFWSRLQSVVGRQSRLFLDICRSLDSRHSRVTHQRRYPASEDVAW